MQRFALHTLLAVGLTGQQTNEAFARIVLGKGEHPKNVTAQRAMGAMRVRIAADWDALREKTQLLDGDLAFAVHLCFETSAERVHKRFARDNSVHARLGTLDQARLGTLDLPFAAEKQMASPESRLQYEAKFSHYNLSGCTNIASEKALLGAHSICSVLRRISSKYELILSGCVYVCMLIRMC